MPGPRSTLAGPIFFMHVIDLTHQEASTIRTQLFEHYFSYWGRRNTREIPSYDTERLQLSRDCITSRLPPIEQAFSNSGLMLDQIDLVLVIGQGTSNGHAVLADGRALVWIPLEAYASEQQVDVFLTHEIVHGLHYLSRPEYFFYSHEEKNHIGRQTMTEGIATYVTKMVMRLPSEEALWADFLSSEELTNWMDRCAREQVLLQTFVREHWNDTQGPALDLFFANDPNDIYRHRAGYFLAMRAIETVVAAQKLSLNGLLATPRTRLEEWCLSVL